MYLLHGNRGITRKSWRVGWDVSGVVVWTCRWVATAGLYTGRWVHELVDVYVSWYKGICVGGLDGTYADAPGAGI